MIKRGVATHVDELARMFAAAPREIRFRDESTGHELLRAYYLSVEECAVKNDCRWCRRELERLEAEALSSERARFFERDAGGN